MQNIGLYSPMAWVIIGGLLSSTLLSRLVTPHSASGGIFIERITRITLLVDSGRSNATGVWRVRCKV